MVVMQPGNVVNVNRRAKLYTAFFKPPPSSSQASIPPAMSTTTEVFDVQVGSSNHSRVDSASDDTFPVRKPASPDPGPDFSHSERGCRVSRRLGTVSSGIEIPRQERSRSAKAPRHILARIGKLWRDSAPKAPKHTESGTESEEDLCFIVNRQGLVESPSPESGSDYDSNESNSDSDSDEGSSFVKARHVFTDPRNGDDINTLNCFAVYSAIEFWSIDMRLTLLWCLAYEARFRRCGPALELWLAIIEGSRERVDWAMWEDGDEIWLRDMVIQRQMTNRFKLAAVKLCSDDWMRARDALQRRIARPKPPNSLKTWSTQDRVLRIAWCAVTDGSLPVGRPYFDLMKPIDSWTYFTYPFRPSYDQDMKLRLHDHPDCSLASCKIGVWQWFRTAVLDYGVDQIQDVLGCCSRCVSRAFSAIDHSSIPASPKEPAIWPVILWVAFQAQRSRTSESKKVDALLALIESNAEEHRGLWSWDDTDEQTLRQKLIPPEGAIVPWIDRYPVSWREYILLLDPMDWAHLEASTRRASRPRLQPPEYDVAIRVGAIILWSSSNAVTHKIDILLALDRFLPGDNPTSHHGFIRCFLEGRVPVRANHYELNLGPDAVDWKHPRIWLDRNREQLRATVLHDPDTVPFVHVVENVYMVYHVARSLPLRFMSSIFSCLLKKYGDDKCGPLRIIFSSST
ncbi:hypothetical protein FB451DRAFT_401160 [Mycena latifolia]|nr:hypothetical protein FB451DRAFT_401160 [Mycena latifolia]